MKHLTVACYLAIVTILTATGCGTLVALDKQANTLPSHHRELYRGVRLDAKSIAALPSYSSEDTVFVWLCAPFFVADLPLSAAADTGFMFTDILWDTAHHAP